MYSICVCLLAMQMQNYCSCTEIKPQDTEAAVGLIIKWKLYDEFNDTIL